MLRDIAFCYCHEICDTKSQISENLQNWRRHNDTLTAFAAALLMTAAAASAQVTKLKPLLVVGLSGVAEYQRQLSAQMGGLIRLQSTDRHKSTVSLPVVVLSKAPLVCCF